MSNTLNVTVRDKKGREYIIHTIDVDWPEGNMEIVLDGIKAELQDVDENEGEQTLFEAAGIEEPEHVYRSSVDGEFVSKEFAEANPDTTTKETL